MSYTTPLPHQKLAYDRLADKKAIALFWTMGLGKTKTAIDIAWYKYEAGYINRVLIIAPNTVHKQWIDEQLPEHCHGQYCAHAFSSSNSKTYTKELYNFLYKTNNDPGFYWLAIHVDTFSRGIPEVVQHFCKKGRTFIIVDEATRIKTPSANRTKNIIDLHRKYEGPAMIMTGTALAKRPADVWALFEFLDHRILNCTYKSFEESYTVLMTKQFEMKNGYKANVEKPIDEFMWNWCKRELAKTNKDTDSIYRISSKLKLKPMDVRFIMDNDRFVRYKNIRELKNKLEPYADFIDESMRIQLPPKKYETIEVPLSAEQKRILKQLQKYAAAESDEKVLTIQNKAEYLLRALQICGGFFAYREDEEGEYKCKSIAGPNNKLHYILEDIEELGNAQFLVFAVFRSELALLESEIRKLVPTRAIYGATNKDERAVIVEDFKAKKIQCLVCNPSVAGYGLNLQGATKQYWYSRSFRTEDRIQAEGRSHRIGIIESPVYTDIVCRTQFEKMVLASNREGKDLNDYFNSHHINELLTI